ncbi:MAG: polysaccharide biosynthesis/export family protein [Armatimonadetes bacterium]|nr:polysaccharide biosynthesis/export family protein [Armatimonadota bacterium]
MKIRWHNALLLAVICLLTAWIARPASAQEYKIQPGDILTVALEDEEGFPAKVTVDQDGLVTLPLVKQLKASGQSLSELTESLKKSFSEYLKEPNVIVTLTERVRREVTVLGDGAKNGRFPLTQGMKFLDLWALIKLTDKDGATLADLQNVRITRGNTVIIVNADKAFNAQTPEDLAQNVELAGNDLITISPKVKTEQKAMIAITVVGQTKRTGPMELSIGTKFRQAMSVIGIDPLTGDKKNITVKHQDGSVNKIDYEKAMADDPADNIELQSGDEIYVPEKPSSEIFFTIQGLVGRQGQIPMTELEIPLTGAVAMAGGAAPQADLKRVTVSRPLPDGKVEVTHINMENIYRKGKENFMIRPGDIIFVMARPGRFNALEIFRYISPLSWFLR